jgi:uncharacterized membrane protein
MKSIDSVNSWEKRHRERMRRLKVVGWLLMILALLASVFAYATDMEFFQESLYLSAEEREGYYMMSVVFAVMGIFCLNATWRRNTR